VAEAVRVKGLREFQRALRTADKETRKKVQDRLKEAGDVVRASAADRFAAIDAGSASGFRVKSRQRGVSVEQTKRRVTGKRGDYGALQMRRALIPALEDNEERVVDELDRALDEIKRIVEG
jgi:hypothetical protein